MNIRRALGISALSQLAVFTVNFATVVAVSRLLTPEEIGIFSVSAAVLTFAHVFREFGVGQYLIQARKLDREKIRAAFTVTLAISWTIAVLLYLARQPIARFYGSAGVAEVLALISINFVLIPFGSPLLSLLRREMRFDKIAIVNVTNALVSSATTVAAAAAGTSYLSMGWGAIAGVVANVVVLNWMRPGDIFMLPTTRGLREVLRFGSVSSAASIIGELSLNAPDLILGKTLGFSSVAYFSRANGLRKMAQGQLIHFVRGVYLPSFASKVRAGEPAAELYGQSMVYLLAFTAPMLALLALLADPLILLLFGPQWARAAPLASILCVIALVTSPTALTATALIACGRMRLLMRTQLVMLVTRLAALATSIWLDLEHVVMLLGVAALLGQQSQLRAMRSAFGLRIRTLWRHVRSAYLLLMPCALAGPVLMMALDRYAGLGAHPAVLVAGALPLALAGWAGAIAASNHPLKKELAHLRNHFDRRRAERIAAAAPPPDKAAVPAGDDAPPDAASTAAAPTAAAPTDAAEPATREERA